MRTLTIAFCIASADAFAASCASAARGGGVAVARASVCAVAPLPPPGFVWADEVDDVTIVPSSTLSSEAVEGVVAPTPQQQPKEAKKPKKVVSSQGIFAPLVRGAKQVMGETELNQLRASVISTHSKVISQFVDTSDSPFGQIVLRRMFEYADKDGNGSLDREEVRAALRDLGFDFVQDKQLDIIFGRADENGDLVIDFEEFVQESPKTLRSSLIKLAKQNGHDLGFLA